MKLELCVGLSVAFRLFLLSSLTYAQSADDYRYEIKSVPEGAAVFVGKVYKGVTPYSSDWVKKPAEVSYTLVKGGSKVETIKIQGIAGSTASVEVKLKPTPDLDLQQAGMILEAIRAALAKTELHTETQAGFPNIGAFLTDDFKTRAVRALRLSKEKFLSGETAPLPRAVDKNGEHVEPLVWIAQKIAKTSPTDRTVETGIGFHDALNGDILEYGCLMVFTNQGGVWLLSNCLDVGQDTGNDE